MRVADTQAAPRRSHVRTSQRTRSMTRAPRPRSESPTPSAADLERMFEKLGGKIDASEERVRDEISDVKAQGDARAKVSREAMAEAAARDEAFKGELERVNRRMDEVIATGVRSYRQLDKRLDDTNAKMDSLPQRAAPEVEAAAKTAANQVVDENKRTSHRLMGAVMVGGGLGGGAMIMGCLNFIANHTALVLNILHVISLGLVKVTATPHE